MSNRSSQPTLRVARAHRWTNGTAGGRRRWGKSAACARTPCQPPLSATLPEKDLHARKVPHLLPCVLEGDPACLTFGRVPPDPWPCGWPLPHPSHLVGIMPWFFTKLVSPNSLQGGLQSYTEPSMEMMATTKSRRSGWRLGALGSSASDADAHGAPWELVSCCLRPLPGESDHEQMWHQNTWELVGLGWICIWGNTARCTAWTPNQFRYK